MDKAASARFREEGNAAFRRGRWRDAAAAYTRASEADPGDAVPLANRAQAWIKLERWPEAEADATAALALTPTVKSLYRRALARRAQGNLSGAAADLRTALDKEPNNAVAADELAEVEREMRAVQAREAKVAKASSGNGAPSDQAGASAPAGAPSGAQEARASGGPVAGASPASVSAQPQVPAPRTATSPALAPTSAPVAAASKTPASTAGSGGFAGFAALRTTRNTRPAYAGTGARPSTSSTSHGDAPTTPGVPVGVPSVSIASQAPRPAAPASAPSQPPPPTATTPSSPTTPPVPTNPSSTAPGAGLALLRTLRALPPSQRRGYLRHYTPDVVGRIVAPVLEPDGLGMLFAALADEPSGNAADAEWTRDMLAALKQTPRYRMNCAMLSRAERAAGERAWKSVGGEL